MCVDVTLQSDRSSNSTVQEPLDQNRIPERRKAIRQLETEASALFSPVL